MFPKRVGIIAWVSDIRQAKNLERIGSVLYISKRLNYVVLYVNEAEVANKIAYLEKLHYVKKVELSHRSEISSLFTDRSYVNN